MDNKNIGHRLKVFRTEKGLTQKEMADILGVNPSTYTRIETGDNAITIKHCLKLNKEFGLSLDELILDVDKSMREYFMLARKLAGDPVLRYQVLSDIYARIAERELELKGRKVRMRR